MSRFGFLSAVTVAAALALPVGVASAAPVSLINAGFEAGNLSGWNSIGSAAATPSTSVTTFDNTEWTINAHGTGMAQLNSAGASIEDIESFLGLSAGTLNPYNTNPNGGELTEGAALSQTFSGTAGDTLSLYWDYVARDYIPYNDPSFAIVIAPDGTVSITVLASIHGQGQAVGTSGHSGWQLFEHDLTQTGNYKIAFVTTNDKDTTLDSALFIDDNQGSCVPNCPPPVGVSEPGTLAVLGLGFVGLALARRRRNG